MVPIKGTPSLPRNTLAGWEADVDVCAVVLPLVFALFVFAPVVFALAELELVGLGVAAARGMCIWRFGFGPSIGVPMVGMPCEVVSTVGGVVGPGFPAGVAVVALSAAMAIDAAPTTIANGCKRSLAFIFQ
jgi:hypothetical protein